jgi:uncharacterized linocin/CFP29 family protein
MNHLLRELAPVSAAAWAEIEAEARRTLKAMLAARKLVDFAGPRGWEAAAVGTGRTEPIAAPVANAVEARVRRVLPLVELRAPFAMHRAELEAVDRGAKDVDTAPVREAARQIAIAEDRAVFHGHAAAGIRGICQAEGNGALRLPDSFADYPEQIAVALNRLRNRGVGGPYAVALSEHCYTGLTEATKGGYPVLQHVRRLSDGPIVWAPGLEGAVVLSLRGKDFELTVGQDFSLGYLSHDAERVRLYVEESFTFWNLTPDAAVHLPPGSGEKSAP